MLVVGDAGDVFGSVKRLVGDACPVLQVGSLDAAVSALETNEIALIIADVASSGSDILAAFKVLKHEHPEILAIVLTESADAELVIDLINQAQLFRFINKPVNAELLRQHTQAALTRYQSFKQNPHLTRQHEVAAAQDSGTVSRPILERMKALKSRF